MGIPPVDRTRPEATWGREAFEEAFANPGIQFLLVAARENPKARRTVEQTYRWLRNHTECPQIDPQHLETMLQAGARKDGKRTRANRWRKDLVKADKERKLLFKSLPRGRQCSNLAAIILKTVEEIETGAHEPATAAQIETARRILEIERAEFVLGFTPVEDVTEEGLAALLTDAVPAWKPSGDPAWKFERDGLHPPDAPESFVMGETLAAYCFDGTDIGLAEIEIDQGQIGAGGERGMVVRLRPPRFAYCGGQHKLARAALAIEKHLVLYGFAKLESTDA